MSSGMTYSGTGMLLVPSEGSPPSSGRSISQTKKTLQASRSPAEYGYVTCAGRSAFRVVSVSELYSICFDHVAILSTLCISLKCDASHCMSTSDLSATERYAYLQSLGDISTTTAAIAARCVPLLLLLHAVVQHFVRAAACAYTTLQARCTHAATHSPACSSRSAQRLCEGSRCP
jgi:hypothetical protein